MAPRRSAWYMSRAVPADYQFDDNRGRMEYQIHPHPHPVRGPYALHMSKRRLVALVLAVVLFTGAIGVRFVLLPSLLKLPADLDASIELTGTASLVDQAAIRSFDVRNLIREDVPVTIVNNVKVVSTQDGDAVIANRSTVTGPDNAVLSDTTRNWSINRRTFAAAPVPPGSGAQPHEGLVAGFPLDVQARDYPFWDFATQTVAQARYVGTEKIGDRTAYRFNIKASGPVKDPDILKMMPPGVPLTLTASSDATYWVDASTANVLDVNQRQDVEAVLALGSFTVPLGSVFSLEAHFAPETASDLRAAAAAQERGVFLLSTVIPVGLGLLAMAFGLITAWPALRRLRRPSARPMPRVSFQPPPGS
ncbi:porin PorA family protein [Phytohabitans rumicis]|uniref:porin PorA family protein n=1 Tax=Phytohabitans rumicis TaxID=1076125 RepID=UPI0015632EBA|nr:porin PorA family protein [Phytohabitans rumicis]